MSAALLCAEASGVTIALVVFVMLTALLLAFIIMLFTWKRFRDFFFIKDEKQQEAPDASEKNKAKSKPRKTDVGASDDGIPTVPLDGANEVAPAKAPKKQKKADTALDRVPTVVIGNAPEKANDAPQKTTKKNKKKSTGKNSKK
ncbi:MAG: hypothetical protein J1G38_01805 [Clostridiales bacterium]|nr:hypothetical protein [Clostridiales bacterium]